MRDKLNKRIEHILSPEIDLRLRLFQLLSTVALTEFVLVTLYTIVFGGSIQHIVLMIAGTIAFGLTVSHTFQTGMVREGSALSGLIYFMLYPLTFFSSGGMYGGAPAVFIFALVYLYLVTQGRERIVCMALCVGATAFCYIRSYLQPEILTRHDVMAEHAESFFSIMLVTLLVCMLFGFVTLVYRREKEIVEQQKKKIEALNQTQKNFFSKMSHEIRTPVNAIIGLNEINMREELPCEVYENSQNIEAAGRMLLHTINEILDMSRLESGGIELMESDYEPTAMLSDIVSMTWLAAKNKGLELTVNADESVPPLLHGDEMRIKQILLNLVSNAVKYTNEGSVKLSISCRKKAPVREETVSLRNPYLRGGSPDGKGDASDKCSEYVMCYDVADTGIGIREEDIPYLFDAFQRADEEKNRHIEGTGLGLSIVKQLAELMDGTVNVMSEYGKGTVFHVEILQKTGKPAAADTEALSDNAVSEKTEHPSNVHPAIEDSAIDPSAHRRVTISDAEQQPANEASRLMLQGVKVLAVDDTRMNLMVVTKLLRDTGAELDTAASGAEALEKTAQARYDVILMDHQMPEMDGIECMRRIKTQEEGASRESKIICLTANAGPEMERRFRAEGFDGFLEKPIRGSILKDEISIQAGKSSGNGGITAGRSLGESADPS